MIKLYFFLTTIFGLCSLSYSRAQAENDFNWIFGYPPSLPEEYFGGVRIDFNQNTPEPIYYPTDHYKNEPAILSSNTGRLLAYSNGCDIYNSQYEIMQNGDSIAFGLIWESYCYEIGYPGAQHHILLPWPGDTNKAILLYLKTTDDFRTNHLLSAIIKFDDEYPLGRVIEKDNYLLDPGITALLSANKHANGRDWWIILPEANSNNFFTMLLSPYGLSKVDTQAIGDMVGNKAHSSQAIFTPDGRKYIRFNPWNGLDIFDFNRCTGILSNAIESGPFTVPIKVGGGVACSADSRYLYVSNYTQIFQFDLTDPDILSTKYLIGTYDGYGDPLATRFYHLLLAPDGKIYMFSTNDVRSLHVINEPDQKGDLCNFVQHSLQLPAYIELGAAVMPYFRLGPDDYSSCDTLGINNEPIAYFRYAADTLNHRIVSFTNLSYFEPEFFEWNFGNGQTSIQEKPGPVTYSSPGTYDVCLRVSNEFGSHTVCQKIVIQDTISAVDPIAADQFQVLPNPFNTDLNILSVISNDQASFSLYTSDGILVMIEKVSTANHHVNTKQLCEGLYFYTLSIKGTIVKTGKLVKTK